VNSRLGSKSSLSLSGDTVAQSDKEKADSFNDYLLVSEDISSLPDFLCELHSFCSQ